MACGPARACKSALETLLAAFVAGRAETLTVRALDGSGSATAGGDRVEVELDSVAEGRHSLPVQVGARACL